MAATVNLDPQKGVELAEILTNYFDKDSLELVQSMYDAMKNMGDNNCTEHFKERFGKLQDWYNSDAVPGNLSTRTAFDEYTDVSTHIKNLSVNTAVSDAEVGTMASGTFDAARNL